MRKSNKSVEHSGEVKTCSSAGAMKDRKSQDNTVSNEIGGWMQQYTKYISRNFSIQINNLSFKLPMAVIQDATKYVHFYAENHVSSFDLFSFSLFHTLSLFLNILSISIWYIQISCSQPVFTCESLYSFIYRNFCRYFWRQSLQSPYPAITVSSNQYSWS